MLRHSEPSRLNRGAPLGAGWRASFSATPRISVPSASRAASDSSRPVPPSLWRDDDFRRLWVGQTASQLGEHASLVILPLIAVLTLDAGAGQLGILRAVGQTPILLLS